MRNLGKQSFIALLVLCLLLSGQTVFAENQILQNQAVDGGVINQNIVFIDVQNHWANDAIYDMASKGIVSGYEDSTFQPEKSITREEFAKLIALTFSLSLNNPEAPTYTDVNPDRWSYRYIESTKDFLTGYYPPRGKAFFSPGTQATREDVAVALVKVLGYTTNDAEDTSSLQWIFNDADKISIGLRDYVAIATEKQLISGYEDGTFRPDKPITRAEVSTLLYRVIKSSAQDQEQGPQLEVSMPETTQDGTFYISGMAQRDARVTINDNPVPLTEGQFNEGYRLESEGTYEVVITAKLPSGKATTVRKQITYATDGPVIQLIDTPATVNQETITVSGTVTDANDPAPQLYLNDQLLYNSSYSGSFSTEVKLAEGENTLTFRAKNMNGKETTVTKTITFSVGGPVIQLNPIPETSQHNTITVSGTVTDANDSQPVLYLNDQSLYVSSYSGNFTTEVALNEGKNTLTFKAANKNGKTTVLVKNVSFNAGGPELRLDSVPDTTSTQSVTISGTVKDTNDSNPIVYINDRKVYVSSYSGTFSEDFTLEEGDNTFTVKAVNANGKETVQTKKVTFGVGGPVLRLSYYPENTRLSSVTIEGTVTDKNDSNPVVYFNDRKIYVSSYSGTFSEDLQLVKGANTFKVVASNNFGKTATVTVTVYRND